MAYDRMAGRAVTPRFDCQQRREVDGMNPWNLRELDQALRSGWAAA